MKGDNTHIREHRAQGAAIFERLKDEALPAALAPAAAAFKTAHDGYEAACLKVETPKDARDAALAEVAAKDGLLDSSVEALATALVTAGLGTRTSPFAAYSKFTPSKLEGLAYATEAKEVLELCKAIAAKQPPAPVTAATAACTAAATAVQEALKGVEKPQSTYDQALAARDALLPEWTRLHGKFHRRAVAEWEDVPGKADAIFAPPSALGRA